MSDNKKNLEQHELEKIRMKKLRAMMEAKKMKEATQERVISITEKIDYVLQVVLAPDAFDYLINLKNKEPHVYQLVYNELISPEVVQNINYLLAIIRQRGGVPRKIPLEAIMYLERKVKGIRGKIQVKRGDEIMDLGSFLSKE